MKVLVTSINFWPDHSGIALYSTDLPVYLAEKKYEVTMVTGFSYYPKWRKLPKDRRKFFTSEIYEGVRVLRGYLYVPKKVSTIPRIFHELSFVLFAACNFIRAGRHDCIIVISPPLLLGLVGIVFKWLWKSRLVFYIQDLQPDVALALGMVKKGLMIRLLLRIEKFIYAHSDHVATITEGMRRRLLQKGVPFEKLGLYYNWIKVAETSLARESGKFRLQHPEIKEKWMVAYAGNIGIKQGVDILVILAEAMHPFEHVHFVIAGDGADKERLQKLAAEKKLTNLTFLPFLSQPDYFDLLQDIQLSFIAQRKATGDVFFPSKLLGIMAMSKPVLISADKESELACFVRKANSGLTVDVGDVDQLATSVRRLYEDPNLLKELGGNAREAVEQFDREVVLGKFLEWMQPITSGGHIVPNSALNGVETR
jgi:colanic acid biosynthesis glycosyl transferase WcaI